MKRAVIVGLCLLLALGAVAMVTLGAPTFSYFPRPFDAAAWQAADALSVERCRMLLDLRYRIGLEGRSKTEVAALLGPAEIDTPDLTTYPLCPSTADVYVLELIWDGERVGAVRIRDT